MRSDTLETVHPVVHKTQHLLRKIDNLRLPQLSRHDVECILVRQTANELDRALPWQQGHGRRTEALATAIGKAVGLSFRNLHDLKLAALLHDIGLLMLPATLTEHRESFEPESYVAIQNHPRLGAKVLEPFSFLREASILIAHHHERWDGCGYPYGIRGPFVPLGARILAIADAYDAIKVPNVPDPAVGNLIKLKIIQVASGTQFDPDLVAVTIQTILRTTRSARCGAV